jgi:hypothetical protein
MSSAAGLLAGCSLSAIHGDAQRIALAPSCTVTTSSPAVCCAHFKMLSKSAIIGVMSK